MELILKYFPDLSEEQKRQFAALYDLFSPLWVLLRSLLMMRKDERVWR